MIRRTRGVCLASDGTLYERIDVPVRAHRSEKQEALGLFRSDSVTLLDLRQTLSEERRLFAGSCSALAGSPEVRRGPTLLLVERPSITALSTRNCHRSRRPALRLMIVAYLSTSWMSVL